jgi:hypothetical protein
LRDLFRGQAARLGKGTFEVDNRKRRISREDTAVGYDFVALRHDRRRLAFRQLDAAFDRGLAENERRAGDQKSETEQNRAHTDDSFQLVWLKRKSKSIFSRE